MTPKSRLARLYGALAAALAALSAASAGAEPPPAATAHQSYSRTPNAASCMRPEELARAVETRLGRRVFVPAAEAHLQISIRARRERKAFLIDVTLSDREQRVIGKRRLTTRATHCSALDDSLALVIALAVDVAAPLAATAPEPVPPSPVPPPPPPPPPAPLDTPLRVPSETPAPRAPLRWLAGIGPVLAVGALPDPGPGLQLRFELHVPRLWPIIFAASAFLGQTEGSERGARFDLQTVQLGVCPWQPQFGAIDAAICVEQLLGRFGADSFGFDQQQPSTRWLPALGPSVQGRYWLSSGLFVMLSAALWVPPIQRRYYFTDGDDFTFYEPPWAFGTAQFLVGIDF
jgi:hypothetical protein